MNGMLVTVMTHMLPSLPNIGPLGNNVGDSDGPFYLVLRFF